MSSRNSFVVHIWSLLWLHKSAARATMAKTWCCYLTRTTLTPWLHERRGLEVRNGREGEGRWYIENSIKEWLPVEKSMGRFRRAFPLCLLSNTLQSDIYSPFALCSVASIEWINLFCNGKVAFLLSWSRNIVIVLTHLHWGIVLRANWSWSRMQFWTPLFSFRSLRLWIDSSCSVQSW